MKKCCTCKQSKPLELFSKCSQSKDGLNWRCRQCSSEHGKLSYQKHKEKIAKTHKNYIDKNKEKHSNWMKDHYLKNKDLYTAKSAFRRAAKLQRTPKWLTKEHKKEIKAIFALRKELSESTGKHHEVDHIVPLQGETVSGLHVPWNLRVVTRFMNRSKGNKTSFPCSW
jgi:hypothetical protein